MLRDSPTPTFAVLPTPTASPMATTVVPAEGGILPTATAEPSLVLPASLPVGRERFGVGAPAHPVPIDGYPAERLGFGWYLSWWVEIDPVRPAGADFWQLINISNEGIAPDVATIRAAARANPGSVWIVGNEPDVPWQANLTPERYAEEYDRLYRLLKESDPTCRVAIAGIGQPTPLRMAYLDRVLAAYQAQTGALMPVDVWTVHNFILREEQGSWGLGIPPGLTETAGVLYELEDHDSLEVFGRQLLAFRRWMAERGQQDKPLAVTEFGILMPADYGFDQERVEAFMVGAFDFLYTARDSDVGYPTDDGRLVQQWAWFSLADTVYPTGNLFDPITRAVTPLGVAFSRYLPPDGAGQ